MGTEIERKYLLANEDWRPQVTKSTGMRQGYLCNADTTSVRVRIAGDKAHLNIKSGGLTISRQEFEYEIPLNDAEQLLNRVTNGLIEKTRHLVQHAGLLWEIDEFSGDNQGLVVAEVELEREDQAIQCPDWLGPEVSEDPRYYNVMLIENPYKNWADEA
jgi:adenylate cyclase